MKKSLVGPTVLAIAMLFTASVTHAQTTTLSVAVGAEAALSVNTGTTTLSSTGTNFTNYTTATPTSLTYFIRTTQVSGTGNIMAQVTADFSPAGGPSVATPPTAGDLLTYTSSGTAPGNNGTGAVMAFTNVTASTTSSKNVATFSADNRSLFGGNSELVTWTLTNDPKYKTGSYSATVTFTISAS